MESSYKLDAQPNVYKHMMGYATSVAVNAASQLRIPKIIWDHGKPMSLEELVAASDISPMKASYLYRLMRLLENAGFISVVIIQGKEMYNLTTSSELLIKGKIPCLGPFYDLMHDMAVLAPMGSLSDWFKKDETITPFCFTHGKSLWDYVANNSEFRGLMDRAMDSDSETLSLVISDHKLIFQGMKSIVDVGGGRGDLAKLILLQFPDVECTVLDLPHVVAGLHDGRIKFKSGDMFKHIPQADVVMLKVLFQYFINHNISM